MSRRNIRNFKENTIQYLFILLTPATRAIPIMKWGTTCEISWFSASAQSNAKNMVTKYKSGSWNPVIVMMITVVTKASKALPGILLIPCASYSFVCNMKWKKMG